VLGDEVFKWLSRQPDWQRDLARRVAATVELDESEYAEALRVVKRSFGVPVEDVTANVRPIEREDVSLLPNPSLSRLLALGSLQGVGLVGESEELTFGATGLTLIYGQNAVGKSSYVRALKGVCRTVDRNSRILGNVYEQDNVEASPSARIRVDIDGVVSERRTKLIGDAEVKLPGVCVFDTACAELYVNAQNIVQYIPSELRLLARLATVQDRMRRDLASERQALEDTEPSREAYPPTTGVGRALAGLRSTSSDPGLRVLSTLSAKQQERIAELRRVIAAAAASTAHADALVARREAEEARALASSLIELAERAGSAATTRLREAVTNNVALRS